MIWFGWVWFYGISTTVGYLMLNSLHTYKAYMTCTHIFLTFLNEPELILFCIQLKDFKYCYHIQIILFTINHLFAHS